MGVISNIFGFFLLKNVDIVIKNGIINIKEAIFTDFTVSEINSVMTVVAQTGRHMVMKERQYYGLSLCINGKITYTHNGQKSVSLPDNAVFLPQNATYELYNNEGGEFPIINFCCTQQAYGEFFTVPIGEKKEELMKLYNRLKKIHGDGVSNFASMSILYKILDIICATDEKSHILKFIGENYGNTCLNNKMLAKEAGMAEDYFRKIFKERYGTTPKQYILSLRIKNAKQKLEETRLSVNSIAEKCGFSSVYHFCRAFKKSENITPSEYRKIFSVKGI